MKVIEIKNYKNNLYSSLSRDLSEFEKNFLLISGGILAFSITFIKEIVKIENACYLIFLFLGWGLIIFSIFIMMLTFLKSATASDKLWKIADDFLLQNKLFCDDDEIDNDKASYIKEKTNSSLYVYKKTLKRLRYIAVVSFISGLTFLSIYIASNLLKENKNNSNPKKETITLTLKNIEISKDSLIQILNYGKISKKAE